MSPASLYRLYDAGGELLYVGISMTPMARLAQHRSDKSWWVDVGRIEVASFDTKAEALKAEAAAIASENPTYNIAPGTSNDERLPDTSMEAQLITAGVQAVRWTARRDELVRQAKASGMSLRVIGQAIGLSHTAIAKIVAREV